MSWLLPLLVTLWVSYLALQLRPGPKTGTGFDLDRAFAEAAFNSALFCAVFVSAMSWALWGIFG